MMQQTKAEVDMRKGTIARLEAQLRDHDNTLVATRRDLQNANAAVSHHAQTISQLQTQCQVLSKEHEQTKSLLDTRTRELTVAEKFLTKHDTSTNKEIVENMEGLNYDVAQIVMSLVDHMVGEAWSPEVEGVSDRDDEIARAVQLARSWFGTTATEALQSTRHADDSLLLGIFVQSCLIRFAAIAIVQWHFGRDYASVESLGRIFRSLEEAEPAAVSGQWKILTRRHARLAFEHDSDPPVELGMRALDSLTTVLLVAGLGRSRMSIRKEIWESVGDRVEQFVQLCLQLNDAVGDGTVSAVMSPIWVAAEEKWDAQRMDVVNSGQDDSERPAGEYVEEFVLCTTGLGLPSIKGGA